MGPLLIVNKIAKHVLNTQAAPPANWVLWSMVDALVCQGLTEHIAAQANAPLATIVATLVQVHLITRAQAATQLQTLDS